MEGEKSSAAPGADGIAKFMPYEAMGGGRSAPVMPELSGKMFVLWRLMKEMRRPGNGADVSIRDDIIVYIVLCPSELSLFSFFLHMPHRKLLLLVTTHRRWISSVVCAERITGASVV